MLKPNKTAEICQRTDTTKVMVRIDKATYTAIKRAATKAGQSINLWMVLALRTGLEQR